MAHTRYPATIKQTEYIKGLLNKREVDPKWHAQALVDLEAGLDSHRASKWIGWLTEQPTKPTKITVPGPPFQQFPTAPWPTTLPGGTSLTQAVIAATQQVMAQAMGEQSAATAVETPPTTPTTTLFPGIYEMDGVLYRISKYGSGLRAKTISVGGGRRPWYTRSSLQSTKRLLEGEGRRITANEAANYGIQSGWCICCGRQLTDPESVSAGIGPTCAAQQGRMFA